MSTCIDVAVLPSHHCRCRHRPVAKTAPGLCSNTLATFQISGISGSSVVCHTVPSLRFSERSQNRRLLSDAKAIRVISRDFMSNQRRTGRRSRGFVAMKRIDQHNGRFPLQSIPVRGFSASICRFKKHTLSKMPLYTMVFDKVQRLRFRMSS